MTTALSSKLVLFLAGSPQTQYYLHRLLWVRICGGRVRQETAPRSIHMARSLYYYYYYCIQTANNVINLTLSASLFQSLSQ